MSLYDWATDGMDEQEDDGRIVAAPVAPARQTAKWSRPDFDGAFTAAAQEYGVDADVLRAMAHVESRFNTQAVSPAGAVGVMQFMPATAKRFGIDPTDPVQAIFGAAAYMRANLEKFDGDYEKAVAGYNAGENHRAFNNGDDWRGRLPGETRNYIESVLGMADQIKQEPSYQPLPRDVRPSTAGAGRGLVNPPLAAEMNSDVADNGPKEPQDYRQMLADRAKGYGAEVARLRELNPWAPIESVSRMANDAYERQRDAAPTPKMDRQQQYSKNYASMGPLERQQNAQFDAALEQRLNRPFRQAEPDERGDRISTPYNPISAAQQVQAQDIAQKQARQAVLDRDYTPEMTAETVLRDTLAGALKIGPTAFKSFTDLASMATAGHVGRDTGKALDAYMKWIDQDIGSDRAQAQARNFSRDMADDSVNFVDALSNNPGALLDQLLPTVGSMALPIAAAGAAGKVAQMGRFAKGMESAALAARVGRVQEAATIGATTLQNASDSFNKVLDKGGTLERAYLAAGITAPFTLAAGKLTSGGAENALAMRLFNRANAAGRVTAQEADRFFPALAGAMMKEGAQEAVEQFGQTNAEAIATNETLTPQRLEKEVAVAATLGAAMGGGMHAFTSAPQAPRVQDQPTTPVVPTGPSAPTTPTAPVGAPAGGTPVDQLAAILQREGLAPAAQDQQSSVPINPLADEIARIKGQQEPSAPVFEQNQHQVPVAGSSNAIENIASDNQAQVVLQNRDRVTPSSISQMQGIVANPDYGRLGFSRDFANGAPVVAGGSVAPEQMGKQDVAIASNGRRIPVQYAVVEAADVLASNRADGTTNTEYGDQTIQRMRAIAGNGRIAGLQEAYQRGTAKGYMQEMSADALHGIDPQVVASMRAPVLVRVMPASEVTANIGDLSNTTNNLVMSAVEQAKNDVQRVSLDALQFSEDGAITPETVRQFVRAMPQTEQGGLIDTTGQPTKQAVDRLNAAVFASAYGNDQLVRLYAQAQDPEARNVMSALAQAAPKMARLEGAGSLDIRDVVTQAAEIAVNARRDGKPLSQLAQQLDMAADPLVGVALEMIAANPRSVKPMVEALRNAADFAYTEASKPDTDMFGQVPRASREDVINTLRPTHERGSTQNLAQPRGGELVQGDADRIANDGATSANPAAIEAGGPAQALTSYTPDEIAARQDAQEQAQRKDEAQQRELDQRAQADAQRAEFTLTGSDRAADANPAQQGLMFSRTGGIDVATRQAVSKWQDSLRNAASNPQTKEPNMPTPAVLRHMGAKAESLTLPRTYLRAIIGKHSDVPAHVFENLPSMLADPLFIIPHKDGGVRVFVDAKTSKREPIFVGVDIGSDGRINTVSPLHDWNGKTGAELLGQALHNALSRPGKIYTRNKEALEQARASAAAAPAILAMHRDSVSRATVITRDDAVKLIESGKGPKYSFAGRNAATANIGTLEQAQQRTQDTFELGQSGEDNLSGQGGLQFSRAGNYSEAERQFKETERSYGGRDAYDRAKDAGKTRLTYRQWVQVRTPKFKAWFGDWEAVRARDTLQNMGAVPARLDAAFGPDFSQAKALAKNEFDKLREKTERDGFAVVAADGRKIAFSGRGFKEVAQHSADRRVLSAAANLQALFESAVPLYSSKPDDVRQQVAAFHYYGVKADFGQDGQAFVMLEVIERSNGDFFYDADATSVEEVRAASSAPLADQTKSGAGGFGAARHGRLAQWVAGVNPQTVSKVVDPDTSEPLVVYHALKSEIDVFRTTADTSKRFPLDAAFFAADRIYAVEYGAVSNAYGGIGEYFLSVRNPSVEAMGPREFSDPEQEQPRILAARQRGSDGVIFRGDSEYGEVFYAIFSPIQIKSATGNNGQFDPTNPDIRYSFAGRNAATANIATLEQAQQRTQAGEDAEAVRQNTGWHQGVDGEWRFEISDKEAALTITRPTPQQLKDVHGSWINTHDFAAKYPNTPEGKAIHTLSKMRSGKLDAKTPTLDMVIEHPALFAAYPWLSDIRVAIDDTGPIGSGAFSQPNNAIVMSPMNDEEFKSVLLHEIQHAIQEREGFATGGSPTNAPGYEAQVNSELVDLLQTDRHLDTAYQKWASYQRDMEAGREFSAADAETAEAELSAIPGGKQVIDLHSTLEGLADPSSAPIVMRDRYIRLAGEVEARNTQVRAGMDDAQRRATAPSQTQDVADADQIVRRGSGRSDLAPTVIGTPVGAIRRAIAQAYGVVLAKLEAQGLVTLAQTQDEAITAAAQARADKTGGDVEAIKRSMMDGVLNSVRGSFDQYNQIAAAFTEYAAAENSTQFKGTAAAAIDDVVRDVGGGRVEVVDTKLDAYHLYIGGEKVATMSLSPLSKTVEINTARMRADGSGKLVMHVALEWAFNNGYKLAANGGLTKINTFRFTESMLASALRHGTTSHLKPEVLDQGLTGWGRATDTERLILLLQRSYENTIDHTPSLDGASFDSQTGQVVDQAGNVLADEEINQRLGNDDAARSRGIGLATFKKALVIGSALQNDQNASRLAQALVSQGNIAKVPHILYSANGAIQGFYDAQTGRSFLIADNLNEQTAPGVLMHEVGVHMAADGALAAVFDRAQQLLGLSRGNAFMDGVRQRLSDAGETSAEEAAAYIVEAYENDRANAPASVARWVKDFMASVRAWMFKHKILIKADGLSVADLAAIARANAKSLANGGRVEGEADVAMSQTSDDGGSVHFATAPQQQPAQPPAPRSAWRDSLGHLQFAPGRWLWDKMGDAAAPLLDRAYLRMPVPAVRHALRNMKLDIQRAMDTAGQVAGVVNTMPEDERAMVSDIIERELKAGVTPPAHAVQTAAMMTHAFDAQSNELVRLGMLSQEAADRWRGVYLPRFYAKHFGDTAQSLWAQLLAKTRKRQGVMQGIKGSHLKGRGMYQTIQTTELPAWQQQGWEVRDATFDPAKHDTVQVWRDFTRDEREQMGEIRDAGFRFVMGYMQTQKDIALGRMFESISQNPELASRTEQEGFVQVPDTTIPETGAKRYGKLAGLYVPRNVMSQLSGVHKTDNAALDLYRKALSQWKAFKTVYNPVAHVNNLVSNLTMAHFAGVSYWDAHKYAGAIGDMANGAPMLKEARDAGLFLGSFTDEELGKLLPPDLQLLLNQQDSKGMTGMKLAHTLLTWGLRRPAEAAYEFGDRFFKYMIFKDARAHGLDPQEAVDHAQKFIFNYDDLPQGARGIRDVALPFFSYTYKAIPALAETALTHPHRMIAPAAILHSMALAAYALAAGGDDEDQWEKIKRYVTDDEFRAKADKMREDEYELLPKWMKGVSALGTPKTIRLGTDEATQNPVFIDVSRFIPGGDLFDVHGNAGGVPWLQPLTPSNPLFSIYSAMFVNKDTFTGKPLTEDTDTRKEAAKKRAEWLWRQSTPAIAVSNQHWDRMVNAIAHANGDKEIPYLPEMFGGALTGIGKDGQPVQPKYAALNTFGIKARPQDLDLSEDIQKASKNKSLRELEAQLSQAKRMNRRGALSDRRLAVIEDAIDEKKQRLRDGQTVDGEERR